VAERGIDSPIKARARARPTGCPEILEAVKL
jgi:hypothetical protein